MILDHVICVHVPYMCTCLNIYVYMVNFFVKRGSCQSFQGSANISCTKNKLTVCYLYNNVT